MFRNDNACATKADLKVDPTSWAVQAAFIVRSKHRAEALQALLQRRTPTALQLPMRQ